MQNKKRIKLQQIILPSTSQTSKKKIDDDFYPTRKVFLIRKATTDQDNWYLDSCASRHICNKRDSFSKLYSKSYKFVTANRKKSH